MYPIGPRAIDAPPAAASASEPLRRFLQVARGAGLRVSAAEGIDAARAVALVGLGERALLKDTLALILAKTPEEKQLYDETFDLYFRREEPASSADDPAASPAAGAVPARAAESVTAGGQHAGRGLANLLESGDRAGLAAAMEAAGRDAGLENIRYTTQRNLYARRIMERMGLREVEAEVEALHRSGEDAAAARARALEARVERLRDAVRDLVERSLVLYARGESEAFREELLKSTRLSNLERRHLDRMRVLVRQMAKKLATRYAKTRRRRQRGQLDVRRTMRRNMGWGGIPFVTSWKQRRIEKPRVLVLCDVSGSVAAMSQFLLMFLYALTEALSDIRSFAYSGSLIEVSHFLENEPIEQATVRVMEAVGYGSSDYGNSLADFEEGWMDLVGGKTTLIILGDARGNGTDPRTDILARIAQRARRVVWLNPEPRSAWGSGDSDMYRYAPYCSLVRVCSTLRHLERVIADILEQSA